MNTVMVTNLDSTFVPIPDALGAELAVSNSVVTVNPLDVVRWLGKRVTRVELSVKGHPVHYTLDNTDPASAGVGSYLAVGLHVWSLDKVRAAKFIRAGGDNATIRFEPGT